MVDHQRLSEALIDIAGGLVGDYEIADVLGQLCDRAVGIVPAAAAGVMLEDDDGHLRFVAATDEVVRSIEALQIEVAEGPCLRAYTTGEQVLVGDLASAGELFPTFAARAMGNGLRGVYSFPMRVGDRRIGALNLYSIAPTTFSEEDRSAAQVLADVATTAIINSRTLAESSRVVDQLQHALGSRVVIEQAKGKVSEQLGIPVGEAFEVLRRHARSRGLRLRGVAEAVVAGELRLDQGMRPGRGVRLDERVRLNAKPRLDMGTRVDNPPGGGQLDDAT